MKLKTITIKNFLSYGPTIQNVDFSQESIISFIGNNGHGKSALLEAITWVIWGQARRGQGVSKSDDMLIHLGETAMSVSITIEVNNKLYQIERNCEKKHTRLYTSLSLFSIDDKTNEINNLSAAHQKNTQEIIEKIIGIDHEIFINTVYLKQGSSNEFSKKTAKERKDILCSLLKINKIEEIRQLILEDIKKITYDRDVLIKIEEKLLDENKKKYREELQQKLELYQNKIEQSQKKITESKILEKEKTDRYQFVIQEVTEIEKKIDIILKNIDLLYAQYILLKKDYCEYCSHQKQLTNLSQAKKISETINIEAYEENLIHIEKERELSISHYEEKKNTLNSEFQKSLESLHVKMHQFIEYSKNTDIEKIKEQINIINYRISIISYTECPGCLQFLSDQQKKILEKKLPYDEKKILENTLTKYTDGKQKEIQLFEEEKEFLRKQYNIQHNTLEKDYQEEITKLNNKKKDIEYSIKRYQNFFVENQNIFFYEKNIEEFKAKKKADILKNIIKNIYQEKNNLNDLKKIKNNLKNKEDEEKNNLDNHIKEKNEYTKYIDLEEKKLQEIMNYLSLLDVQIQSNETELSEIKKKIIESEENLKIKSNLAHMLSKNNLQASIIEEAIPFIEDEANRILEKLTDGNSKIYIESMRDLKSGTIKETLDIKIADQVGLRYYEFFSGGEAFRIDLALRISLIKLLTKRSGYSVKTFIIDEGFGSQDSQNLENIIQTLYLLQNEFDLIIIISHLNDMKEQFPIQFLIQKTINGSIIQQI